MNQKRLWADPEVRRQRQAAAEKFMGRKMDLDPLPKKKRPPKRAA